MHQTALIRDRTVAPHQNVVGDCLPEHLDLEDICDDLFCFPIDIWMDESDIVVTCDDISEGRKSFFNSLDGDGVWEGVAQMLELLVGGGSWN